MLIVLCLIHSFGYAKHIVNAKHIEFMGIPIAGTINEFQAKLLEKGLKVSEPRFISVSENPYGNDVYRVKYYEGRFAERDSHIIVSYDARTKKVFECRVLLSESYDKEPAISEWNFFKKLLLKKYNGKVVIAEGNSSRDKKSLTSGNGVVIKGLLLSFSENPKNKGSKSYGSINLDLEEMIGVGGDIEFPFYLLTITYRKNGFYGRDEMLKDL